MSEEAAAIVAQEIRTVMQAFKPYCETHSDAAS
jgi:hypothetical protein